MKELRPTRQVIVLTTGVTGRRSAKEIVASNYCTPVLTTAETVAKTGTRETKGR